MTARFYFARQGDESRARIGKMVQHANRKRVVEDAAQRQMINIGLNNVRIFKRSRRRESGFHGIA